MNHPWIWLLISIFVMLLSFGLASIEKKLQNAWLFLVVHLTATISLVAGYGIYMVAVWTITDWSFWPIEISWILVMSLMSPIMLIDNRDS